MGYYGSALKKLKLTNLEMIQNYSLVYTVIH